MAQRLIHDADVLLDHFEVVSTVTLDIDAARRSLARRLALRPQIVCPAHREPLVSGAAAACESMSAYLAQGGTWPLLG